MEKDLTHIKKAILGLAKFCNKEKSFFPCRYVLAAQWCKESAYGTSKLAVEANNFSGLKSRKELSHFGEYPYLDWEGKYDPYVAVENPEDFILAYHAFIERSIYSGYEQTLEDGEEYIRFIAGKGFCGSVPWVDRRDFDSYNDYVAEVRKEYAESVIKLSKQKCIIGMVDEVFKSFSESSKNSKEIEEKEEKEKKEEVPDWAKLYILP